jgi:hypothetical protein
MLEGSPSPTRIANYVIAFQHYAKWSLLANDGMCLLVTRIYQMFGGPIHDAEWNWQDLLMAALLIAQQVIDDIPLSNGEFPQLHSLVLADTGDAPCKMPLTLRQVNELEVRLLKSLNFQIHMPTAALLQVGEVLRDARQNESYRSPCSSPPMGP